MLKLDGQIINVISVCTARGANANTLRSSALALWQNTAAQCGNVPHVNLVDAQLQLVFAPGKSLKISGTVRSTPLHGCPFSQMLIHQLYDAELPQTS